MPPEQQTYAYLTLNIDYNYSYHSRKKCNRPSFMPLKVIEYQKRKIVVVDGQPYYQSTGENSRSEGTWFPFIMAMGTKAKHWDSLPDTYNTEMLKRVAHPRQAPTLLIKYEVDTTANIPKDEQLYQNYEVERDLYEKGRIPTTTTLITSIKLCLGTGVSVLRASIQKHLTKDQLKQASIPIIIDTKLDKKTNNPDVVNDWLIKQGAQAVQLVLNKEIKYRKVDTKREPPQDEQKQKVETKREPPQDEQKQKVETKPESPQTSFFDHNRSGAHSNSMFVSLSDDERAQIYAIEKIKQQFGNLFANTKLKIADSKLNPQIQSKTLSELESVENAMKSELAEEYISSKGEVKKINQENIDRILSSALNQIGQAIKNTYDDGLYTEFLTLMTSQNSANRPKK